MFPWLAGPRGVWSRSRVELRERSGFIKFCAESAENTSTGLALGFGPMRSHLSCMTITAFFDIVLLLLHYDSEAYTP